MNTINFIGIVAHNLFNWLVGLQYMNDVIKKNKDSIKCQSLLPNSIPVYANIVNGEARKYYSV